MCSAKSVSLGYLKTVTMQQTVGYLPQQRKWRLAQVEQEVFATCILYDLDTKMYGF